MSEEFNFLVLGNYPRGNSYVQKLFRSKHKFESGLVNEIHAVGPNFGAESLGATMVNLDINNNQVVVDYCLSHGIDVVIPDSEDQLTNGLREALEAENIHCAGIYGRDAWVEADKGKARNATRAAVLVRYLPRFNIAVTRREVKEFANKFFIQNNNMVALKWAYLCGGKGFRKATPDNLEDVLDYFDSLAAKAESKGLPYKVVVEEFIENMFELSVFYFVGLNKDGTGPVVKLYGTAEDYKFRGTKPDGAWFFEGQEPPVTGGVGSNSPAAIATAAGVLEQADEIAQKFAQHMFDKGTPYQGMLYLGLGAVKNKDDSWGVKIVEFNIRGGDPEEPTIDALLDTDVVPHLLAIAGVPGYNLEDCEEVRHKPGLVAVNYALQTEGYPDTHGENYGREIKAPNRILARSDVHAYWGPTRTNNVGIPTNQGSRFLEVVITSDSFDKARAKMPGIINPDSGFWCPKVQVNCDVGKRAEEVEAMLK